jgi:hypothetical protein
MPATAFSINLAEGTKFGRSPGSLLLSHDQLVLFHLKKPCGGLFAVSFVGNLRRTLVDGLFRLSFGGFGGVGDAFAGIFSGALGVVSGILHILLRILSQGGIGKWRCEEYCDHESYGEVSHTH